MTKKYFKGMRIAYVFFGIVLGGLNSSLWACEEDSDCDITSCDKSGNCITNDDEETTKGVCVFSNVVTGPNSEGDYSITLKSSCQKSNASQVSK